MKVCHKCKINKNDNEFRFEKNLKRLRSWCFSCDKQAGEIWRRKNGIKSHKERLESKPIVNRKICTRCHIEKEKTFFRTRIENGKYEYINSTCKECDKELSKIYYDNHKNITEFKQNNVERVRKYANSKCEDIKARRSTEDYRLKHNQWNLDLYHLKKDEINAKLREKRKQDEYKTYIKSYNNRNKKRILETGRLRNNKYIHKVMKEHPDKYAVKKLTEQLGLSKEQVLQFPKLIEAKIILLNIKRKIKNHGN